MSNIKVNPHHAQLKPLETQGPRRYTQEGQSVDRGQIKVKHRDSDKLEAYKLKAQQDREKGKLGSKAQILDVKAQIEGVSVQAVRVQAQKLTRLEVLQKYARLAGSTIVGGIKSAPGAVKNAAVGLAKSLPIVSHVIEHRQMKALRLEAGLQREKANHLRELAGKIAGEYHARASLDPSDKTAHLAGETYTQLVGQANQADRQARALDIEANGKSLKHQMLAKLQTARNLLGYGGLALSPVRSSISQVADLSAKVQGVQNQATQALGMTAQGLGIVGGGITIATESYDLVQTGASLKASLNQRAQARQLLMTPAQRESKIEALEAAASKAEAPGRFFGPNPGKAQKLRDKADAMRSLNEADKAGQISEADKAIAQLAVNRTDGKFKLAKMAKNLVGIGGGTLAVVAGALAVAGTVALLGSNPVGWAALGVGLTAAVVIGGSIAIYAGVKAWRRNQKIENAENNQQQIELKREAITQDRGKVQGQVDGLKATIEQQSAKGDFIREVLTGKLQPSREQIEAQGLGAHFDGTRVSNPQQLRLIAGNTGEAIAHARHEIGQLTPRLQEFDANLTTLKSLEDRNLVQLMAASPTRAGARILEGYRKGDPAMIHLAEQVLKVPPHVRDLPDNLALKYFCTIPVGPA